MEKLAQGIHSHIPMEVYHGDCCEGPSISASGLIEVAGCPVKYWAYSPLNPNRFTEESTKALNIGRVAHALALGDPPFDDAFVVLPEDPPKRPTKAQRNAKKSSPESLAAIAFWDSMAATGKQLVSYEDHETVKLMAHALQMSPQVSRAFEHGKPEQSLIWKDKETGVWLKSRPDWFPNDPRQGFIADYKTAETIEPYALSNAVFRYGYHVQAAMQVDGAKELTGALPLGIAHVCQEKDPPYLAELRMFSSEQIEIGRKVYRTAVRKFADCLSKGKWPGYTVDAQYFETPFRIAKQDEELNNGSFSSKAADRNSGKAPSARDYAETP